MCRCTRPTTARRRVGEDREGCRQIQHDRARKHVAAERDGRHVAEPLAETGGDLGHRMGTQYLRALGRIDRGPGGQPFGQ